MSGVAGIRAALADAQPAWAARPIADRVAAVSAFIDGLIDRAEALAAAVTMATGKPACAAMDELVTLVAGARAVAAGAPEWLADDSSRTSDLLGDSRRTVVRRVPLGVVAMLTPYNFPLTLALANVLPALLAGNVVMLKVSEVTPGVGKLIEELLSELADGSLAPLVRVLHGAGEVGAAMVDAARGSPDHVLFIGSVAVGRKVAAAAGAGGVGCTLELGGKDSAIICADADVPSAVQAVANGAFYHGGQCCIGVERAYVVDSVYDAFVDAMVQHVREKVSYGYEPAPAAGGGDDKTHAEGKKPTVTYGCATAPGQLRTIQAHVDAAVAAGAKVLTGGQVDGVFYPPTVLTMPNADTAANPILRDETFGPVLPIVRVSTAEEGVAAANDSAFGLGSYVFTQDTLPGGAGDRLARRLQTGGAVVNDMFLQAFHTDAPFGGVRSSGCGRTGGREGLLGFTTTQTIVACPAGVAPDWEFRESYSAKLGMLREVYGRREA
ncbi:hypothetical protein MMPV_003954 [Pyropia vietnamensis]